MNMDLQTSITRLEDIPADIREQATVIVLAEYQSRAGSHIPRGDEFYVRPLYHDFIVKKVYLGNVLCDTIVIDMESLSGKEYIDKDIKIQHKYFVLLKPSNHSMKIIADKGGLFGSEEKVSGDEIVAIIEASGK